MQTQFSEMNQEIITFVEACPDSLWHATCANDGRSVGVVAHHIASSHEPVMHLIRLVAEGQPLPALTSEMFHTANAQHATQFANCTQAEVIALLRSKGESVDADLSKLSVEQLQRSAHLAFANDATMRAQDMIEHILIGHPRGHLANMQATAQ